MIRTSSVQSLPTSSFFCLLPSVSSSSLGGLLIGYEAWSADRPRSRWDRVILFYSRRVFSPICEATAKQQYHKQGWWSGKGLVGWVLQSGFVLSQRRDLLPFFTVLHSDLWSFIERSIMRPGARLKHLTNSQCFWTSERDAMKWNCKISRFQRLKSAEMRCSGWKRWNALFALILSKSG